MSWITDRGFWRDTAERALSSAAQGAITGAGLDAIIVSPSTSIDIARLGMLAGVGGVFMGALTLLKCIATAAGTRGNPSIGAVSTPSAQVVEQVKGGNVIAGEANEAVPAGQTIRGAGSLDAEYVPQRAADPEQH